MIYQIIDIETTGFNRQQDNILEVGYITINEKCEILRGGSFYFYKPEWKIETQAQAYHKLSRRFLEQFEGDYDESLAKLYTLMYNGNIIGKNSQAFDVPMICNFVKKNARYLNDINLNAYWDMQDEFKGYFRGWYLKQHGIATNKSGKLGELMEMLGYTQDMLVAEFNKLFPDCKRSIAHGGLFDAYMTYLLVKDACENKGKTLDI